MTQAQRSALRAFGLAALLSAYVALSPALAQGEPYPSKPIKFVVPFPGVTENIARAVGDYVAEQTKQAVIVEPRPGSNGVVGAQYAAKLAADGYNVLFTTNTTQVGNPAIYAKLSYDPEKDFTPITGISKGALLFVVPPSVPVKNMAELVALAKSQPGKLTFGWAGSSGRAAVELLNLAGNVQIRNIPYKTAPQGLNDLLGGSITLMAYELSAGLSLSRSGKLKALGISTLDRLDVAPEVPTVREQGFADFEMTFWVAAYVPAGTPATAVTRLNSLFTAALKTDRVRDLLRSAGMTPYPTTPEGMTKFQASETDKWKKIVVAAGMQENQ